MLKVLFESLIGLFFPRICNGCKEVQLYHDDPICLDCSSELPLYNDVTTEIQNRLWGRVELTYATALLLFYKQGIAQNLLHQFKYKRKREVGEWMGSLLAEKIDWDIDFIIPVPTSQKNITKRGFNQTLVIAKQISSEIDVSVLDCLYKVKTSKDSQVKYGREARFKKVLSEVKLSKGVHQELNGKRVLLVDDLMTTGATVEACTTVLNENIGDIHISMAVLAIAAH